MELVTRHFSTLPSTNRYAKGHLRDFDRDKLTWITASEQTEGYGQYGRRWISSCEENITGSFVFFIQEDQESPLSLTHVLAIAVVDILERFGMIAHIKFPNDLIVENKKIGGILCETVKIEALFGVVIGLGLNVNMSEEMLATVGQPATSLYVETGKKGDLQQLSQLLSASFESHLSLFLKEGFGPFMPRFLSLSLPRKRSNS